MEKYQTGLIAIIGTGVDQLQYCVITICNKCVIAVSRGPRKFVPRHLTGRHAETAVSVLCLSREAWNPGNLAERGAGFLHP